MTSPVIVAAQVTDFVLIAGNRIARLTAKTPEGAKWLAARSIIGKYSASILLDTRRASDFIQEIENSGLTVSRVTG